MKKEFKIIFLGLLLTLFFGCSSRNNNIDNNGAVTDSTVNMSDNTNQENLANQKTLKNQINIFLNWYKTKFDTLSTIMLVSIPDTDVGIYSVNFSNTEEYLKVFIKSKLFTQNFIEDKRKYFNTCNDKMLKDKQNQGPPIGLEHDIILLTQEIDETLNNIGNASFSNYKEKDNKASVDVTILYKIRIYLINEDRKWLIDKIEIAPR
ncbi:MAG: hypothetical protein ACK504_07790 [Bacteroidota bacterium]